MKKTWVIPVVNKWFWIVFPVIMLFVAAVLGLRIWFSSPGIRQVGQDIHVEISEKCYIIDGQTGKVVDETTMTINGSSKQSDTSLFEGELKIHGYQNSATGKVSSLKAIEMKEDGGWEITHLENCVHKETVDGITKDVEHFCDYSYTYYIFPDEQDLLVALIESFEENKPQYAVCARSEKEALDKYVRFLEK